ncbi:MAG: hypothetical protein V3V29_03765 [Acidimicrobiia bacterium]
MNHTVTLTDEERLGLGHIMVAWRDLASFQCDAQLLDVAESLLLALSTPGTAVKLRSAPDVVDLAELLSFEGEIGNLDTGQSFDNDSPPAVRHFWRCVAALALADVGSTLTVEKAIDDLDVLVPDDVSSLTEGGPLVEP